MVLSASLLHST